MKKNNKILPLTLSTTLTLFSFSALPAAANTDDQAEVPVNVLNEENVEATQTSETVTQTEEVTEPAEETVETAETPAETTEATPQAEEDEGETVTAETTEESAETTEQPAETEEEKATEEAEGQDESSESANNENEETAIETTEPETSTDTFSLEIIKSILEGEISAFSLVLSDGSRVVLEYNDGTWFNGNLEDLDNVAGIEIVADGQTYTYLYSELLAEVQSYISGWIDSCVSLSDEEEPANLLTSVNLVLPGGIKVDDAKLKLGDGSYVELDEDADFAFLGETKVDADSVTALWLMIDGEEYTIDLTEVTDENGVLKITVTEADLGLNVDIVNKVELNLPEGIELEKAKLVLADGTLVDLEVSGELYALIAEGEITLDEIAQLWVLIDGEEYTIDLTAEEMKDGVLDIIIDKADLDLDVVTKVNLTLPADIEMEGAKLVLTDGTLVELEASEDLFVLLAEGEVTLDEIAQLWVMINGEEYTIDITVDDLTDGVLDITVEEADLDLDLTAVTGLNLNVPDDIEVESAELILVDGTVIDLDITDGLDFEIDHELLIEDLGYLTVMVNGVEYAIDLSEKDAIEGVLNIDLGLDVFYEPVNDLNLELPEGIELDHAKIVLADGTLVDVDDLEDFYLENATAIWLMIDGEEYTINLADLEYELDADGVLAITITEDVIEVPDVPEDDSDFLTGITINLGEFEGNIESAVLVYGDDEEVELEIVDGKLVLDLADLDITVEELLELKLVVAGVSHVIEIDEDSLTVEDGEVTVDVDVDVENDTDTDTDNDTDNDSDSDEAAADDSDEDTKKSGMLPYTGEKSNMLFYLTGLLISALGVFGIRKKKFEE
ncbi:LPXTG cell wall anchor domain-containing protein [Bacillus sp. AK031]